ncbi:hypothetical protein SAMN05444673_1318 [Bacillus sp. OV166]|nr:hypothetical protein SAMN05444673_1318 [Bacillus sp. OV166]
MAMVKFIDDLKPTLIGAEGAKTSAGGRGRGGSPDRREPHAPGAEINSQGTQPYF